MINGSTHAQLSAALGASWMSNIGDESNSESEPASSGGADTPAHGQFQGPTTSVAAYMFSTTVCVLPPQHRLAEVSPTSARNHLILCRWTRHLPDQWATHRLLLTEAPAYRPPEAQVPLPYTDRCTSTHQKIERTVIRAACTCSVRTLCDCCHAVRALPLIYGGDNPSCVHLFRAYTL